ncbi:serine protease [Staphylococcus felis]|uniref:trypsin-like peptidase domain-containing protein n=1 Tax=Staphylococcus felis TaxID=46127 RepID=UPI000E262C22|nr:trypsin-like peptidase domain-containing protein [Staphylococcus felis]REH74701.1 serine protease [Staphylococcus felis]REH96492.1 serine protease [Staphylococcus felis]REI03569.1 serine protease [Staphylococcus felis]REI08820.1 serine protease [Staphylococcus felis]REI11506.1 serine protease [Staphylococcus felis]
MKNDEKHVIPRRKYKRQRREFFHNEEREQRIKEQEQANALKAQKEKEQMKNNEERVKDNLRKARVEKITHEDYDKSHSSQKIESNDLKAQAKSSTEQALNTEEAQKQQNLYKQQAKNIQKAHSPHHQDTNASSEKYTDGASREENQAESSNSIHHYSTRKDWTEKVTAFISKEWAKILVVLAVILIIILLFAIFNNVNKSGHDTDESVQAQNKTVTSTMKNAKAATHSVVSIENNHIQTPPDTVGDVEAQSQIENESGSGVVYKKVDDILYVLTNAHVVGDREEHELTYGQNRTVKGKVIGKDKWSDLAVIKVEAPKNHFLKPLPIGDSKQLILGEPIIVVGNPLSIDFQNTVGEGIVSGLNRNVPVDIDKDNQYDMLMHAFQVDAPINPGDSGGAIIDQNGNLIGIASLKISMPNVENMAFGIPINDAIKIADTLEEKGKIDYPNTSIKLENIEELTSATRQKFNISNDIQQGVMVKEISKDSPTQHSGLKVGDVIIAVDGKSVQNTLEYRQKIFQHTDEKKAFKLKVSREGEVKEISFKLKS